ncbi:hypothetical protein, conserved [Plasmodium gonderi]|uniref:Uncharacterized protein n=1 Tax=Plasmodium gonderi TaxID=77519 RepID=A0A1Y1JJY0_PLAGO|nr:hypothetical protein, conserved [Plasmodium gonderi]GAW81092.1 hypothetical protein, conserved [Plasmodium gonderi]
MIKREHSEKREKARNGKEYREQKKKKKKRRQMINVVGVKYPNDLKSSLYNMCLSFSYSDIYQEYIKRLSLNSYNNCDYDQIKRNSFIPREDFLKYYNFTLYDNNFELESEENYENKIFKDSDDDISDMEEVGKYALERYDAWGYKTRTSRIKNLILGTPERKNIILSNLKKIKCEESKDEVVCSKSYASELFRVLSERKHQNCFYDNYDNCGNSKNCKNSENSRNRKNLRETLRGNIKSEEEQNGCLETVRRRFSSFFNLLHGARESSFMSNLNIYFLNYHDIDKKKIKNSYNENYIYMLQNLAEVQNDPIVEKYYKGVHEMRYDRCMSTSHISTLHMKEELKNEDERHGQMITSVRDYVDSQTDSCIKSSKMEKEETHNISPVVPSEPFMLELEEERKNKKNGKKVRLSENFVKETKVDKSVNSNVEKRCIRKSMKRLCSEEIDIYFKKVLKNEIINFNQKSIDNRDKWNSVCHFVCSCIGASLSAQCYLDMPPIRSTFDFIFLLLLLLFCYLFIGLPVVQMEYALGQISQGGIINSLNFLQKKFRGIAIVSFIISFYVLSKNVNNSVETAIVLVGSLANPLPWNLNECKKISLRIHCLQNEKCKWLTADMDRDNTVRGHTQRWLPYTYKRLDNVGEQVRVNRRRRSNASLSKIEAETKILPNHCTSVATSEGHRFFSQEVKLTWKFWFFFLIILILYFLLRIDGMCLFQILQYAFFLFFLVVFFQIFILYHELKSQVGIDVNKVTTKEEGSSYNNKSIFFNADYFLYLNFEIIAKVFTTVLISLNCCTGINYMLSSYTNIGENIFVCAWYAVIGSFIGLATHLIHYYFCAELINYYPLVHGKITLGMLAHGYGGFPLHSSSVQNYLFKKVKPINDFIIYIDALSRVKFQNIMSLTYFLSSLLALLTSSAIYLKGIIIVLKESKKFKNCQKKVITVLVIVVYFFLGIFYLFPFGHNTELLVNYSTSSCIYLIVISLQVVCITWIYGSERTEKLINWKEKKKKKISPSLSLLYLFVAMWLIPIILVYLYRHIFLNIIFFIFSLFLLLTLFVCVNAYFVCKINLNINFREKIYFLYLFNVDLLRIRLNNILYGKRRTYDLEKEEKCSFGISLLQKLTNSWCYLTKFFIPHILIIIALSNLLYNIQFLIHRGRIGAPLLPSQPNRHFEKNKSVVHSYLRAPWNGKNEYTYLSVSSNEDDIPRDDIGNDSGMQSGSREKFLTQHYEAKRQRGNSLNLMQNMEERRSKREILEGKATRYTHTETDLKGTIHTLNNKNKSNNSFGAFTQLGSTIIMLLLIIIISLIVFINPDKMNFLTCAPTNTWKINDVHSKKMNPINYSYTRHILFFEEMFSIEKIMPSYVWTHINRHIKKNNCVTPFQENNDINQTIHDNSFAFMNKNDFENHIFNLIDHGSKLSHFADIKLEH